MTARTASTSARRSAGKDARYSLTVAGLVGIAESVPPRCPRDPCFGASSYPPVHVAALCCEQGVFHGNRPRTHPKMVARRVDRGPLVSLLVEVLGRPHARPGRVATSLRARSHGQPQLHPPD